MSNSINLRQTKAKFLFVGNNYFVMFNGKMHRPFFCDISGAMLIVQNVRYKVWVVFGLSVSLPYI